MKLSIITTVYKAEKDLPRLLDSMMAQKSPELEFFLIDNGSPDRCGEICREYAKKDPRFTVYTLAENIGYIRARNLGIEVCDGDYIGFCDSDDYLEPGGYDRAVEKIRETGCDFYAAAYNTVGTETRLDLLPFTPGLYENEAVKEVLLPQAFGHLDGRPMLQGFMWKHILRRSIVLDGNIRFFEPLKPYEDQLFNIDAMKRSRRVYIDDSVIYNYIVNEQSITAKMKANFDAEAEWQRVRDLYEQKRERCGSELQNTALCNQALWYLCIMCLNMLKAPHLTFAKSLKLLRGFDSDGIIKSISRGASIQNSHQSFARWCLLHGRYGLLLGSLAAVMKLRRG